MAKRKNRETKNTKVTTVAVDKIDRGTVQTRARRSPDPLLSATLESQRAQAGLEIRAALEEGFGAQALDIFHPRDRSVPLSEPTQGHSAGQ